MCAYNITDILSRCTTILTWLGAGNHTPTYMASVGLFYTNYYLLPLCPPDVVFGAKQECLTIHSGVQCHRPFVLNVPDSNVFSLEFNFLSQTMLFVIFVSLVILEYTSWKISFMIAHFVHYIFVCRPVFMLSCFHIRQLIGPCLNI